jgi:hypothetical protein
MYFIHVVERLFLYLREPVGVVVATSHLLSPHCLPIVSSLSHFVCLLALSAN